MKPIEHSAETQPGTANLQDQSNNRTNTVSETNDPLSALTALLSRVAPSDPQVEVARIEADKNRQITLIVVFGILSTIVLFFLFSLSVDHTDTTDEAFLTIIQWSLGVIFTLGFALLGYQWFAANKSIERERDSMRHELSVEREIVRQGLDAFEKLFDAHKHSTSHLIEDAERSLAKSNRIVARRLREDANAIANKNLIRLEQLGDTIRKSQSSSLDTINQSVGLLTQSRIGAEKRLESIENRLDRITQRMAVDYFNAAMVDFRTRLAAQDADGLFESLVLKWSQLVNIEVDAMTIGVVQNALNNLEELETKYGRTPSLVFISRREIDEFVRWVRNTIPQRANQVERIASALTNK